MKKIESVIDNCIDEIAPAICSNSVEEPVLLNDDLATKSNINIDKEEHLTLMDEDGSSLNLNLENMLLETFEIFDLDGDGYLNKEELDGFATFTNGEIFDENTLEELAWGFDVRSTDNALSKRGFIEMYTLQTIGDPKETIKDLKKFKIYDKFLNSQNHKKANDR